MFLLLGYTFCVSICPHLWGLKQKDWEKENLIFQPSPSPLLFADLCFLVADPYSSLFFYLQSRSTTSAYWLSCSLEIVTNFMPRCLVQEVHNKVQNWIFNPFSDQNLSHNNIHHSSSDSSDIPGQTYGFSNFKSIHSAWSFPSISFFYFFFF